MQEGVYEVRAELPGVDPAEDIEVTVRDGRLTIKAERTRPSESNGRSEFTYGSFVRTVALPEGADEDDINATYDRGILTVSDPLSEDTRSRSTSRSSRPSSSTRTTTMTTTTHARAAREAEHTRRHQPVG